jgi:hypothetical protein
MSVYDDWVTSFCSEFRQRCEHLQITAAAAAAAHVRGMPTLFAPCQIYILGSSDPTFQFLLITHNDSRPDMDSVVQVDVPAYEFVEVLEVFKGREEFRIPRSERFFFPSLEGPDTLGTFLERWFAYFLAQRWAQVVNTRPGSAMSSLNVGSGAYLYEFRGRVIDQSAPKLAGEMVDRLQRVLGPQVPQPAQIPQPDARLSAYGAYIYPTIQLGEAPKMSFRERASGPSWDFGSPKVVIRGTFRRIPMCVGRDGLVMMVTQDRSSALDGLNRLMAGLLFLGLPVLAVREGELVQGTVDPDTLEITGSTASLSSLRNIGMFDMRGSFGAGSVNKVEAGDFQSALALVDAMTSRQGLNQDLLLFLESTSHLADQEYTPAFLMAWSILERQLSERWRQYLLNSGVKAARVGKLLSGERWSVDSLIECLDLLHELPDSAEYQELMGLKRRRNSIIHDGRSATESDAKETLALAHTWLNSAINEAVGPVTPVPFKSIMRIR